MHRIARLLAVLAALAASRSVLAEAPATFCNPLDLDYGIREKGTQPSRHGADPVIVLFNDRYYLFSTWDVPGYRVSDDLARWKTIPFAADTELAGKTYTAAAVMEMDGWLYFTELGRAKQPVCVYRTRDPDSGRWERVTEPLPPYADPAFFIDPTDRRLFMYHGLDKPIRGVELDPKTFAEINGTDTQLMPPLDASRGIVNGWEVCTWDNSEQSPPMRSNRTFLPCREGPWMTWLDGKYYLQFASPGTTVPGYADGLLIGNSPLGPFTYSQHSPISRKASGFITSAGHSCLFQDRHGNWWRAVTMLIGVHERFERRIGLFPAGFTPEGIPFTRTELGDTPITLPTGPRDHAGDVYAGWWPLSVGKEVTTSSTLDAAHPPKHASDEDIRTWWSARTGDAGEWLEIDLGREVNVRAVQVNLAEQDYQLAEAGQDAHRYALSASRDGAEWDLVLERSRSSGASPHHYAEMEKPVLARYLRLTNVHMPGGGKFAVSDLRAFGIGEGPKPAAVSNVQVTRDEHDRRKAMISWSPSEHASAYLVRYGIEKNHLNQHDLVRGGDATSITLYGLNAEPGYHFAVDAMNDAGRAVGEAAAHAP